MIVELYASPLSSTAEHPELPISNTVGELPDEEPSLNLGDLLGSFSSRNEALEYIQQQVAERSELVVESQGAPFDDYTHVEWLTITIKTETQKTENRNYYLVSDEGY